ncbi:MAG: amino acid adenylation domain-containing protein [Lachnospiraceae bacterium]|nr:amino acid adenylation domain-containing protein [Lachnospiraceae bacterium]
MQKRKLSASEYGIWMNEEAFPGEAINTVGFRLYLPESKVEDIQKTVDEVLEKTAAFRLKVVRENEEVCVTEDPLKQYHALVGRRISIDDAEELWEKECKKPLEPAGVKVMIRPIEEGGGFLIFLFHHLLMDSHSFCQMAQMVLSGLDGESVSEKEIAFRDFVEADEEENEPEELRKEKNFWLDYFKGVKAEAAVFPNTPDALSYDGYDFDVPQEVANRLQTYVKLTGTTEASVFAAALSLYLGRATRSEDAIFLMPRLNRSTPKELAMVGCRTLVVPVRNTLKGDMTFSELCRQTTTQARSASAHKHYGMDHIINDLREGGILNGSLSEYVLNYHNEQLHAKTPYEFGIAHGGAMHNHMTMSVGRFGEKLSVRYDARCGIYNEETTAFFHEAIVHILEQALEGDPLLKEIEIIGRAETAKLEALKGKEVAVSDTASIPDLFRKAVNANPDSPALYAGDVAYTFRELDAVSSRIANALIARGIKQGETVMYKLHRDHRLIPAMLGISKAGAAFIPIDPTYPKGRIDYIQEDSGSAWMITQKELMEESQSEGVTLLDVDELLAFADEKDPQLVIPQTQLAYCIYTSGTTGRPKGVMLSHKGIVNITDPDNNPVNRDIVRTGNGIVAIGSVCFDISLFEFLVPLFNGMFIEFAPESALADPKALAKLIRVHGADMLHLTPSRLAVYIQDHEFSAALSGVEVILAAGEVLKASLVNDLKNDYGIRIYNGYGPTETTIGATITEAGDNESIGKPIANMGILILDDFGNLMPYGATGELCVFGNGVGLGYKNRPEETAAKFTECRGKRIYRTGDLGRYLPDGRIEYQGRNDFQVKIRGLRIELSEIESCMLSYAGVGATVVQVRKISGSDHLVGFYQVRPGETVDPDALKTFLKGNLTSYMVPDILKEIDSLPQTPGGKIDMKAIDAIPVEYQREYREPETELQKAICDAMAAVLKQDCIGLDDNFFEVGGDSLHTAELVMEIEKRLPGVAIRYEDIFHYPVPELLAQYIYRDGSGKEEVNQIKSLDYTGIDEFLAKNEPGAEVKQASLGNVLLTGATGFLGLHILLELLKLKDYCDTIYCLVRPTKRQDSSRRLRGRLQFFDEPEAADAIGSKVIALPGDIARETIFEEAFEGRIDTVINCAADVSHFAYDDKLEKTNTGGVKNLIRWCLEHDSMLVQISTISVGGVFTNDREELTLTEKDLYFGQVIKNQYILSKYMAEYSALRAAVDHGLRLKIMRVGNLQGRLSDGEFQMQKKTNAFTRQLLSYAQIGAVPQTLYDSSVNFSPVDEVARMIVGLSTLPKEYSVFHVYPPQEVPFSRLFFTLSTLGYSTDIVSDEIFEEKVEELMKEESGRKLVEGILVERPDMSYRDTTVVNQNTQALLGRIGLFWNPVTDDYLNKYLKALVEMQITEEI